MKFLTVTGVDKMGGITVMKKDFLIIADDFTGANDTGVQIKKHGIPASVLLTMEDLSKTKGSVVFDTESRVIPENDAYQKVKTALQVALEQRDYEFLYKKVDSTLRGNIVAEIKAMVEVYQPELIVFAPAFPRVGRTTEEGIQRVNGIPLLETELVLDPRNPIAFDNIRSLLSEGLEVSVDHHGIEQVRSEQLILEGKYHTFDAVLTIDMQRIAKHVIQNNKRTLWIGSAGLAEGFFDYKYPIYPVLSIVGSVSESSMSQIEYAQKHNVPVVEVDICAILNGTDCQKWIDEVVQLLKNGSDLIVTAAHDKDAYQRVLNYGIEKNILGPQLSELTKETLGKLVRGVLEEVKVNGLFLTGGDTAISVINYLGAKGSRIDSEVLTGFVLSRLHGGDYDGMPIITKAGAFGGAKDIYYCMNRLKEVIQQEA